MKKTDLSIFDKQLGQFLADHPNSTILDIAIWGAEWGANSVRYELMAQLNAESDVQALLRMENDALVEQMNKRK